MRLPVGQPVKEGASVGMWVCHEENDTYRRRINGKYLFEKRPNLGW